jgi:hypothetical protein
MFKEIFFQHLSYFLSEVSALEEPSISTRRSLLLKYSRFIESNVVAVWDVAQQKDGKMGN